MKHALPEKRNPYRMRDKALEDGWQTLDTIPRYGEGVFLVLTFSGLIRTARMARRFPRIKKADGYGPERVTVIATESGNYLTAIAWKWPVEPSN